MERAFVLHRRPYRETSLLLEVFCREHGRVGLVARGARRSGSERQLLLQPFVPLLLSWSARGELGTLAGAESDGPTRALPPNAIFCGWYLSELMLRLTSRQDPHPDLFDGYGEALAGLHLSTDPEPVLRRFELCLLRETGYGLVLGSVADSEEALDPDRSYWYARERGPLSDPEAGQETLQISGRTLLDLACENFQDSRTLRESKRLIRFVLRPLTGPRPLVTRTLFESTSAS